MIPITKLTGRLGNQMFQYAYLHAQAKEGAIDDIYVQNPKYFVGYEDEIRGLYREGIGERLPYVAIHVRRGDYVGNPFYVDLMATDYYQKAMELFPNAQFMIFSDDIEWCKNKFGMYNSKFRYSTGKDEIEDMNLMAACRGHIIANSSFSWWAAFISPYTEKVVAPSILNWYDDGLERTVCPDHWIRI